MKPELVKFCRQEVFDRIFKGQEMINYILNGHEVVGEPDVLAWGKWFESADRAVDKTEKDDVKVSTVFLGLDHNFEGGVPLLFETMVFGGSLDQDMERYSTWEEAERGHKEMCEKVWPENG